MDVNDQIIIFEPDEERNYRAVLNYDEVVHEKKLDAELLKTIAKTIEKMVK
ncbi:MAG: hypothetical protein ABJA71_04905 [Ginsengibacter sp.]